MRLITRPPIICKVFECIAQILHRLLEEKSRGLYVEAFLIPEIEITDDSNYNNDVIVMFRAKDHS